MPRPQQAHSTTRRTLIRLGAAAGAALGVPAIAIADPIYQAIEHHRETMAPWEAAIGEYDAVTGYWYTLRTSPLEKPPAEMAAAIADADERQCAAAAIERSAADALVETVPTTLAGALAGIRYVLGHYDDDHDLLEDKQLLTLLDTIGDAIEALLARGDGRR